MESPHALLKPVATVRRLTMARFFIAVTDEQQFDKWALLRWADDGGRWVEEREQAV